MKKIFTWSLKFCLACCISFVLLNIFSLFYYNIPMHEPSPSGATEHKWKPNRFYSKEATEGFARGRINNDGYNNLLDRGEKDIDILMMGSSHTEAFQVAQNQNYTSKLNEYFNGEKYAYNIGVSGHNFSYLASNLEKALDDYQPKEYVIMETRATRFNNGILTLVIEDRLPSLYEPSSDVVSALQQIPYLRLMYMQYNSTKKAGLLGKENTADMIADNADLEIAESEEYKALNHKGLSTILNDINRISKEHNVKPVLLYQPEIFLSTDGNIRTSLTTKSNKEYYDVLVKKCAENDIIFVDMTETFMDNYYRNHVLPHGFSNSAVGKGHLNKYGHDMIARKLYDVITASED